jgi:hypothetical protein
MLSKQTEKVAKKFGGLRRFAEAIKRDYTVVYKWTYPQARGGTGGLIPAHAVPDVLGAASKLGVSLTGNDWLP